MVLFELFQRLSVVVFSAFGMARFLLNIDQADNSIQLCYPSVISIPDWRSYMLCVEHRISGPGRTPSISSKKRCTPLSWFFSFAPPSATCMVFPPPSFPSPCKLPKFLLFELFYCPIEGPSTKKKAFSPLLCVRHTFKPTCARRASLAKQGIGKISAKV